MLFWFVYRSPFKAEYRYLTGHHSGHAVGPCFPQRKSSTTRFGGNDHWARLRSKSHPVWKSRWRCEETRFPVWRETPKEKSTWTSHGTDHWIPLVWGVEPLAFWIEKLRVTVLSVAPQWLVRNRTYFWHLSESLRWSLGRHHLLKLLMTISSDHPSWRHGFVEAQQIQRRKLVERSPWRCSHEIISCNAWKRSRKETPSSACPQAVMGQQNMMMFMDFPHYSHPQRKDQKRVSRTYCQVSHSIYFGLANWRFQIFGDDPNGMPVASVKMTTTQLGHHLVWWIHVGGNWTSNRLLVGLQQEPTGYEASRMEMNQRKIASCVDNFAGWDQSLLLSVFVGYEWEHERPSTNSFDVQLGTRILTRQM